MVVAKTLSPSVSTVRFGDMLPLSRDNEGPLDVADVGGLWAAGSKLRPLHEPTL